MKEEPLSKDAACYVQSWWAETQHEKDSSSPSPRESLTQSELNVRKEVLGFFYNDGKILR